MRFFWISLAKDLRLYARNAALPVAWFLLPLVIVGLIGLVYGGGAGPQGMLLLDDEDGGLAGTFLRESLGRGPLGKSLAIQHTTRAAGEARMARGEASALLIIPRGFDRAVKRDQPASLTLVTNPEERLMPRFVRDLASLTIDTAVWLQRTAGPQLAALDGAATDRSLADLTADAGRALWGANTYLNPPLITIKNTTITRNDVPFTLMALLFPGAVFLVLLPVAEGMSIEIWKDRHAGALRRLAATPAGIHTFLAAKVAATTLLFGAMITMLYALARWAFDVPMQAPWAAMTWAVACGAVLYVGLLAVQLALANERTATLVASAIVLPLALLGGSFFPFEIMPESFRRIGAATPNGWMLLTFQSILTGRPVDAAARCLVLGGAGLAAFLLTAWLLRRRAAD